MVGKQTHGAGNRWALTLISAPVAGVLGIFASEVFDRLGWLDPPADALAGFLKANVESGDLGNWLGFILFAVLYGIVLRFAWRMQLKPTRRQQSMPIFPPPPTEGERNARYLEALKGYPIATAATPVARDRNTPISAALGYALYGDWSGSIGSLIPLGLRGLDTAISRFRDAAIAGELRTWGKSENSGLYVLIDPPFWEHNTLDRGSLLSIMGSPSTTEPIGETGTGDQYSDIKVNRAEVERVWPHEG